MIVGSPATVAVATIRARGARPRSRPARSLPTTVSAAPSATVDELPAVWTWSIRSIQWYFCSTTASKPPCSPMPANDGFSAASAAGPVSCRTGSSRSRTMWPLTSRTATSERSNRPSVAALAARAWDSTANASTSSRLNPSTVAIRSALIPCGTNEVP